MADKFNCSKCTRSFPTVGALNGHQRSHSFFAFLGKTMPKEFREKEQQDARDRIMIAAIKHHSLNPAVDGEPHCDICAVVYDVIDKPLMRDLAAYFDSEKSA